MAYAKACTFDDPDGMELTTPIMTEQVNGEGWECWVDLTAWLEIPRQELKMVS